jgi:hypothetical protein
MAQNRSAALAAAAVAAQAEFDGDFQFSNRSRRPASTLRGGGGILFNVARVI